MSSPKTLRDPAVIGEWLRMFSRYYRNWEIESFDEVMEFYPAEPADV